ncbi:MAG: S41 family peptidase, partial [Bacteroidaceae bacterium]
MTHPSTIHSEGRVAVLFIFLSCLFFSACVKEDDFDNTPQGNFEALWKIIDEQYCFLSYKEIDWNEIHNRYQQRISPEMSNEGVFEVLRDMLAELKDGHVNLVTASNVAYYRKWFEDYPDNFNDSIHTLYLGKDYRTAAGIKYKVLDDNIGYIYYGSFSYGIGEGNLDEVFSHLATCTGLIVDVRNNGGGTITNSEKLAARFTNKKILTGYIQHKTGKGHNDFSNPHPLYLEPTKRIRWQKKVVVLTNRHSFSATNDFVNKMRLLPLVTIMGDQTGGGSGLPLSSELPNGWAVRFSSSPHFGPNMEQIEFGIQPDEKVNMSIDDILKNKDTIIESA